MRRRIRKGAVVEVDAMEMKRKKRTKYTIRVGMESCSLMQNVNGYNYTKQKDWIPFPFPHVK